MKVSIIVAMAHDRVIGVDNQLPWHLPADLKYFKAVTMGKPVLMGRKTYESIGRPLPGRTNIVVTRNKEWQADGVCVAGSLEDGLRAAGRADEVMIIGGAQIYGEALVRADKLYITEVDLNVKGDAFFPAFNAEEWREVSRESHAAEANTPAHAYVVYERA